MFFDKRILVDDKGSTIYLVLAMQSAYLTILVGPCRCASLLCGAFRLTLKLALILGTICYPRCSLVVTNFMSTIVRNFGLMTLLCTVECSGRGVFYGHSGSKSQSFPKPRVQCLWEIFGHNRSRSQCFYIQPVTCCDLSGFFH